MNLKSILKRHLREDFSATMPSPEVFKTVAPFTMLSEGKLTTLLHCAQKVQQKKVHGDFVECGTCRGGSAAVLASALSSDRHLWLYDSFQGMPETKEIDGTGATEFVGKARLSETLRKS